MDQKDVQKVIEELLGLLDLKITYSLEEKEETFFVKFQTDNPGLLIGYHGDTLASIQLILSLIFYRKTGKWLKFVVDVGDYRQRRQATLENLAASVVQKVKMTKQEFEFLPMNSAERRIIHLYLANDSEVVTESRGEGRDRRVVIKPK